MKKGAIGIFDSGLGGLQIFHHIFKKLPKYDYVYLGDTARVPYGSRSQEAVYKFAIQAVDFLFKNNCSLIIFACNTVSGKALRKLQRDYLPKRYPKKRILGVIIPAVEETFEKRKKRVGIIATESTVLSGALEREIKKINPGINIFQQACPLLVPIVEAGEENSKLADLALKQYLEPMLKKNIDALILGCTHYGFLEDKIKKIVGERVEIINEGRVVAEKLKDYLKRHPEIENNIGRNSRIKFFSTDLTFTLKNRGSKFFGKNISIEKIRLD
jgi:glutamate racemase